MRIFICFITLLFCHFSVNAQVQQSPNIPMEAYGELPKRSMLVISPSTKRIGFRGTVAGKDLFLVQDMVTKKIISAINVEAVNPNSAYFIDDDRIILIASEIKRLSGYRGKHKMSAAYVYNISTNNIHQLLAAGYGIYSGQTQLGTIMGLSADKKYAYMPAYKTETSYNLYKVNLEKRRKPRIHRRGTPDTIDFFLNKEGEVIARERYNETKDLHRVEVLEDGDWREIYREITPWRTKGFNGLTPDLKSLVMISQDDKHGRWAYYTMSLKDGKISDPIFSHSNKDVENVLTDLHRVVHGVQYSGFTPTYEFFNEKLNARMRGLNKALPNNTFTISDYTTDWESMVFYMDGEMSSGDFLLYRKGSLDYLTSTRPGIPGDAVHPVTAHNFEARDGLNIPTLITTPLGGDSKRLPTIILPHGGPASYDRISFDWLPQYLASQGYLVIQPQFRGSKGFGPQHLLKGRGEWGNKMQHDLTDAVSHFVQQGIVNKDRVCILGMSYGGYAALAGATFTPDLYKCAISINGVSDVEEMLETEERNYGDDHWVVSYWQDIITKGEVQEDYLEQISPINHTVKVKSPILLIHGELDQVVPFEQSEDMFDELEDEDKNVTFVELEGGDHHLSKSANRLKALQAIDAFIKKHI